MLEQNIEQKKTKSLAEKWHAFRQWQQRPHEVAPLSEENHKCHTCGTEFQGNYCPRCGQSSRIGRYSFKNAILLFLDVWGLGNRGMFRTLRDLILRPGYMIRDYLSGMQMAYFPPFKLFFLLTTLSIVIEGGMNIEGKNFFTEARTMLSQNVGKSLEIGESGNETAEAKKMNEDIKQKSLNIFMLSQRFPNIFDLLMLAILSCLFYIFFRRSPAIPDLRYSEFLVANVYIADMYSIYSNLLEFFCINNYINMAALFLPLIPLKQMSGFSWWKVIVYTFLVGLMVLFACFLFGIVSIISVKS